MGDRDTTCVGSWGRIRISEILQHVKDSLRYDTDNDKQNSAAILLLSVSAATRAENCGG
jgi:hypothetical protein